MNRTFGTAIILATHNQKLLDTYKFPRILVADRHVAFRDGAGRATKSDAPIIKTEDVPPLRVDAPTKSKNYFSALADKFSEIAGGTEPSATEDDL